ncbi:phospholipase C, phosphocholine-specific [Olivibacter ginsenosidimutans]|uniref:phospholipase C n=1 Tax=Olivibacter ginsenosidimutans TaxID=1176537 RepID=A0ABP9AJ24_9SPHI
MDTRRDFLKKAAALAGGASLMHVMPASIARAMAINPSLGSTFYDAEHVVLLMQENRSFDHAFGTLQGVRGYNDPRAIDLPNKNKVWAQTRHNGETFAPFRLDIKDSKITWMGCLPHNWTDQTDARNQGKMNKWLDVKRSGFEDFADLPLTMGHYTREDIPFYYSLADAFTICDQHFCSSLTGTNPNRLYFWTGNIRENLTGKACVWNGDSEFSGNARWKTFPERLEEQGISWKIYQNEISSSSAGYSGEANSWLANFGCNVMEYFPQYQVKLSKRYITLLEEQRITLVKEIASFPDNGDAGKLDQLKHRLKQIADEQQVYTAERYHALSEQEKQLHERAFVNNSGDPDYMSLERLIYRDGDTERELHIPKGDVLYQFRKDVNNGNLPTVSWLVPPQLFSDHPDSPWFGAWYVSEVMDILTKNPEVWKKTIFILTYDENDGYFDHIPPFGSPNPYRQGTGKVSAGIDAQLEYVRRDEQYYPESGRESNIGLGYRVPLIIASPWTRGGWVNSQVFDHTSSLQFLEDFLLKKFDKEVKESNITAWRRAVCGNLTSAFRPYHGEKLKKPVYLEKETFMEGIHRAKFKGLPNNFKALNENELAELNRNPNTSPYFPEQEKGIRDACALPYELYVNGHYDKQADRYTISFETGNKVFGKRAAGAPFLVYAINPYQGERLPIRDYSLLAGDQMEDSWNVNQFENGTYHLRVYGPNGFYRSFRGTALNPLIQINCSYQFDDQKTKTLTGKVLLTLRNHDRLGHEIHVVDNSYGDQERRIVLEKGRTTTILIDTVKNYNWYDVTIRCKDYSDFAERFAGRIENGRPLKTDPLMGRVV